jgi:SpoVK/Ycf46/Vps4 family AAA+-type ATPase
MLEPLRVVGADLTVIEMKQTNKDTGRVAIKLGSKSTGVEGGGERAQEVAATYRAHGKLSPSSVAKALQDLHGLLLVDEADAIHEPEDRKKLAQLIKLLSDARSDFKVMVVGIAETGDELTAAHPSVKRCLREVKLRRMDDRELREIVLSGSRAVRLTFDSDVVTAIVSLSAGYPHFTHLLALKCAEDAIAQGRRRVTRTHLVEALNSAVEDAEGSIRRAYNDSVRSQSEMYRIILVSAAAIGSDEFSAADLRKEIAKVLGKPVAQNSLNNYFQRLVSSDGSTILRRTAKGYYRFEDPRTASFIRILNKML